MFSKIISLGALASSSIVTPMSYVQTQASHSIYINEISIDANNYHGKNKYGKFLTRSYDNERDIGIWASDNNWGVKSSTSSIHINDDEKTRTAKVKFHFPSDPKKSSGIKITPNEVMSYGDIRIYFPAGDTWDGEREQTWFRLISFEDLKETLDRFNFIKKDGQYPRLTDIKFNIKYFCTDDSGWDNTSVRVDSITDVIFKFDR